MTNFSKLATLFVLGLFSFSAYSWDVTNKRIRDQYVASFQANLEKVNNYKEFKHIFESYLKSNKKIEDGDYKPLSNATELYAYAFEAGCFKTESEYFVSAVKLFPSATPALKALVLERTDAILDQCINIRLAFLSLSNRVANREITSDFANEYNKIGEDHIKTLRLIQSEQLSDIDYVGNGKPPRFSKISKYRELAKNDVIAQVLNYASGSPEDASGPAFFYPEDISNGKCIYKIAFDKSDLAASYASELSTAMSNIGAITGIKELSSPDTQINNSIDINKADWKNLNFYNLKGSKKNKFTGAVAYLRFQSRVEGLPDFFECDSNSCNVERLKRGWGLVQTKCPGIKKAF